MSGARPLNSRFPSNQLTETDALYGVFRLCLEACFLHMVPTISITNPFRKASYPANGVQGQPPGTWETAEGGIPRLEHVSASANRK
jgi:hypothetical protein